MEKKYLIDISKFTLQIMAMIFMLLDHMWASLFLSQEWMTCIGRIAFPIFAFMIVEGYHRTSNLKKYFLRLFIFALITEIPFDLMYGGTIMYPYHQNVLWTFLLGLTGIVLIEKIKSKEKLWLTIIGSTVVVIVACFIGLITFVDYYAAGVATIFVFYFFRGRKWWCFLGQLICLYYLNVEILGGYYYPIQILGFEFELVQQSFALLALIPIWLYHGRQGYHEKWFQFFCYAFYPLHALILALIALY